MVGLLNAPPGTRLYNRMKKEGRLAGLISCNTDGTTNIIPRMDLNTLSDGYKKIMRQIYSPKIYYERVRTFLKDYKAPKAHIKMDFQRCMAFIRSSIRLGIFGKERFPCIPDPVIIPFGEFTLLTVAVSVRIEADFLFGTESQKFDLHAAILELLQSALSG